MIFTLFLILLAGTLAGAVCRKIHLPGIIGMLATGIILGPYVLDLFDDSILGISSGLREIALIIILIKAGITLDLSDLKKVGRPAVLMSFLPACFEILAFIAFAPVLLGISRVEGALIGSILGAVSPAVVVPRMVNLIEEKYGTEKGIPQMILAGASLDDVFVIVLFTSLCGMAQGNGINASDFAAVPVSVILGIAAGTVCGICAGSYFEYRHKKGRSIRNSMKVIIVLALAFGLVSLETALEGHIPLSGLLAVMSMACGIRMKCRDEVGTGLASKFGKLWLSAEIMLFVLVGAAVDIRYTLQAGPIAAAMIGIGLVFRSIGVLLCLIGTNLDPKEKLFCVISYLPKATVQAAIGSVPLSLGLPCGSLALSVAVLSIILTAPLGAIGMDLSYGKLLRKDIPGTKTETVRF